MPEPTKLLSLENGTIQSACLCWDSTHRFNYITLRDGDVIGAQERISLVNYSDLYLLRLLTKTIVVFRSSLFELSHVDEQLSAADYTLELNMSAVSHGTYVAPWDSYAPLSVFDSLWNLSRLRTFIASGKSLTSDKLSTDKGTMTADYNSRQMVAAKQHAVAAVLHWVVE